MPIFEFRCLKCNECFELLVMNNDDQVQIEMRCPECKSEDFERVLSASCYSMGSGSSESQGAQSKTRSCPSGTCTTYDIPGPPK
jgi:putative FmdB family regulatory protein